MAQRLDAGGAAVAAPTQRHTILGVDELLDGAWSEEDLGLVAWAIDGEHEGHGTMQLDLC